jgi:hypothetical protein
MIIIFAILANFMQKFGFFLKTNVLIFSALMAELNPSKKRQYFCQIFWRIKKNHNIDPRIIS